MFHKISGPLACLAAAFTFSGHSAQAVTMSDLVLGTSLVQGPVTFSDFTYSDEGVAFGGVALESPDLEVDTSGGMGTATLTFTTNTNVSLAADEFLEVLGGFTVSLASGTLTSATYTLIDAATQGAFSVIEFGSNPFGASTTIEDGVFAPQSFSAMFAPSLSTAAMEWDLTMEVDSGQMDFAGVSGFSITIGYAAAPVISGDVPLPASLPLLFAGLAGMGLLRRRQRAGAGSV